VRVARVEVDGAARTAIVSGGGSGDPESVRVLGPEVGVLDVLTRPDGAPDGGEERPLSEVRLLAPIEPPSIRDFSVFEQHIEGIMIGQGGSVPDTWYRSPFCYFSNPGAVTGPGDEIPVPPGCRDLDLELEVAVIIGRAGRDLTPAQAADHIAGYTIFNDWSARDLQFEEMKLGLGICKGKDFANTLGPWIVTPDELEPFRSDDRLDLDLRARINDRELGDDTLANMAWSFDELISYASRGTWIRPGDVLGSGTCGGGCLLELRGRHGAEAYPPLQVGDTVTLTVQGIGTLTNTVVAGVDPVPLAAARPGRHRERAARA
jgi:2-keto-4-pentenoate hydratase/2-oxohepta-3-ene-1,7-dioic acid hydratase in catechol pathway